MSNNTEGRIPEMSNSTELIPKEKTGVTKQLASYIRSAVHQVIDSGLGQCFCAYVSPYKTFKALEHLGWFDDIPEDGENGINYEEDACRIIQDILFNGNDAATASEILTNAYLKAGNKNGTVDLALPITAFGWDKKTADEKDALINSFSDTLAQKIGAHLLFTSDTFRASVPPMLYGIYNDEFYEGTRGILYEWIRNNTVQIQENMAEKV